MSTGHKPTFYAAVGKQASGGLATWQVSVKDQLGQKKLKFRQFGQATQNEMAVRDLRGEIDEKEKQSLTEGKRGFAAITNHSKAIEAPKLLLMDAPAINVDEIKSKYDDADAVEADSDSDLESSDEDEDSDGDDELELQRELERIKAERAAAQAKKEQEEKDAAEKKNRESALKGNPLVNLDNSGSDKVKRRWNDDVVFRNQTRDEPEHKKRFINDTIRNDFHRNFLKKFMK